MATAEATFNLAVAKSDKHLLKSARTTGILHNLGLFWMAHQLPQDTAHALYLHQNDKNISLDHALKGNTGTGYRQAGGYLAKLWNLPDPLPQAMEYHETDYGKNGWEMVLLVSLAVSMAAAGELNYEWTPPSDTLKKLELEPTEIKNIFNKLQSQFERIQQSAVALIGN
jgi:HD-like signal output (HDOD) protein